MKKVYQQFRNSSIGSFRTLGAISMSVLVIMPLSVTGASARSLPQRVSPGASVTYYACVNYNNGKIYMIQQNSKCKSGFTMIQWDQAGPQGPQGPVGPQGPTGVSVGYFAYNANVHLAGAPGTEVAHTNPIGTSGTYYINATALLVIDGGDRGAFCYVVSANNPSPDGVYGGTTSVGWQQASMSDARSVNAGDTLELWCYSNGGDPNTYVYSGELNAILINSPSLNPEGKPVARPTGKH